MDFRSAALTMLEERGWLSVPMGMTEHGLPKRGLLKDVYQLPTTREAIEDMPWSDAAGLALVLGPASRNLGVLDIDHTATFNALVAALGFSEAPRLVRSISNRGHYYVNVLEDTASSERWVLWDGERVHIELRCALRLIVAPPTPGYKLLNANPPQDVFDMASAFEFFSDVMLDYAPEHFALPPPDEAQPVGAGYPKPWSAQVPESERNKTAYMEAHKLREAGTPVEVALRLMQARFQQDYAKGGITWHEIEATVRSAYRKGEVVDRPLSSWGDETRLLV